MGAAARAASTSAPENPRSRASLSLTEGAAPGEALLEAAGVSKRFAGVEALLGVDFDLRQGEVHALVGENGAGKSTLMKILAGVLVEYDGVVRLSGAPVRFAGVQDAERAGVAIIHQELSLVPELTAADNIFLGREPLIAGAIVDRRRMAKAAGALLRRLGVDIDPQSRVAELRVGEQQLIEIAKALSLDARIVMMDEPTSALSAAECETLFKVVGQLAAAGVAIVFTSHRLEEVVALADRVTVLRDGRRVLTAPIETLSLSAIISAMVGRNIAPSHRQTSEIKAEPVLSVRNLTLDTVSRRGWRRVLDGVNFHLRPGEILGIGGLLGSGRSEILESIFGAAQGWRGGAILIDGAPAAIHSPADACRLGGALVTEDRKARGLHLASTVRDNLALASVGALSRFGVRGFAREAALAAEMVEALSVRCSGVDQIAATLSGGNQQKVVIGKWLAQRRHQAHHRVHRRRQRAHRQGAAGEYAVKLLGGPGAAQGNVVEIWGGMGTAPAHDRHDGFHAFTDKEPGIKYLLNNQSGDWKQDKAYNIMTTALRNNEKIDLVYGHNDPMAYGAYLAAKDAGRDKDIKFIIGIDALPDEGVTWCTKAT